MLRQLSKIRETAEDLILSNYTLLGVGFKDDGNHAAQWLKAGGSDFKEPFFSATVKRKLEGANRWMILQTGAEALLRYGSRRDQVYPSGFIFHVGRCGSTLLANMLKTSGRNFVLSEPELPLSAMIRRPKNVSNTDVRDLTRASVLALCGRAPRAASHAFIKFYHGYIQDLPLIREALPGVQEIFVYRDPVEVTMSMVAVPSIEWLWYEYMTGLPISAAVERSAVELAARVVGRLLNAMCLHAGDDTMLVNYSQIGAQTPKLMMDFWGIECGASELEAMATALKVYAKDNKQTREFLPDVDRKQEGASAFVRESVEKYAVDAYLRLEELRKRRAVSVDAKAIAAAARP